MNQRPIPVLPQHAISIALSAPTIDGAPSHQINKPVTIIGSRRDCDFSISHPEVSKVHCAVVHTGATVFVCDLRSRTGTYVNGQFANLSELVPGVALRAGEVDLAIAFGNQHDDQQAWASALSPTPLRLVDEKESEERTIEYAAAVIGRRSTCDICVDLPDISLAHALIFFVDGKPAICDLGSRSGTRINGENILLSWLADGDTVWIGGAEWTIRWDGPIGFDPDDSAQQQPAVVAETVEAVEEAAESSFAPVEADREEVNAALSNAHAAPKKDAALRPPAPAPEIDIPKIDFAEINPTDLVGIGKTIAALDASLKRAQRLIDVRAAELRRRELLIAKRELELRAREKKMEAREAGERAATAQIEQFKVALQLAQRWFQEERSDDDASDEKKLLSEELRKVALLQGANARTGQPVPVGVANGSSSGSSRATSRFN